MASDPRFPAREDVVVADLLEQRANETPDRTAAVFADEEWTWRRVASEAWAAAQGLAELGVRPRDFVMAWLPNGQDALRTWFGANALGAAVTPINPAYRGAILEHTIRLSGAEVMVTHAALINRLRGIDLSRLRRVVVVGGDPQSSVPGVELLPAEVLARPGAARPQPSPRTEPWDVIALIYTSGTTGQSKAVLCSYLHHYTVERLNHPEIGPDDRFFVCLPMFHLAGTGPIYMAVERGCSVAITDGFRTQTFWEDVRRFGTTCTYIMGGMATFLLNRPRQTDDADNPLRIAACNPMIPDPTAFAQRFGVDLFANYGSTEAPVPLRTDLNPTNSETCGRPTTEDYDLRLVDEFDREVPVGEPGELVLRHDRPWSMNLGYKDMPEHTAHAWRNGWFHTGDVLRRDDDGNYYFVDRRKDVLRRRGENISSIEVERELLAFPAVLEAAVVGVHSADGEDEVKACLVVTEPATFDAKELIHFLRPRLPHFMIPRYVEVIDEMPRTQSQKVQKYRLRDSGITASTWDREAAGIHIKRERLHQ